MCVHSSSEVDGLLGLLVRVLLPRQQASDVAAEVVLVGVVEELLHADLGVGFGLLDFGVDLLLYGYLNFLQGIIFKNRVTNGWQSD